MSDGITDGYKASTASENFQKRWDRANAENILLSEKDTISHMSIDDILIQLTDLCREVKISKGHKFLVKYKWGDCYEDSVAVDTKHKMVLFYYIEVNASVCKKFRDESFEEVLKETLLYLRWLNTEDGKLAVDRYNDW